jgi:hypothetical protein
LKIFYDTEFLEDGRTIELISIGMVAEDGRELYLVNSEAPWRRIRKHGWLMANVVPNLPQPHGDWRNQMPKRWLIDFDNPAVQRKHVIADAVRSFIQATADVQLWAWYAAYDHVALSQLWGPMIDHPHGVPMWTNDLRQEQQRLGDGLTLPLQPKGEHNALEDARHNQRRAVAMEQFEARRRQAGGTA